jgi:asparagine synthase (glutamine-hydrolysing)
VERVAALSTSLKIRGGVGKYLLKRIALRHLPPGIVTRRKQGFAVPLPAWFDQDLGTSLHAILRDSNARNRSYLTANALQRLIALEPQHRQLPRLWILAMLELWHRAVLDPRGGPVRV